MSAFDVEHCRSCNAEIIWAVTTQAKRMPVDAKPSPDGNVALEHRGGVPLARALNATQRFGRTDLHTSHFAKCRDAASWRRKRGAR